MTFIQKPAELGYGDLNVEHTDNMRLYEAHDKPGVKYPSITTVLSILSADSIAEWKARVGEEEAARVGKAAAWRGTQVHEAVEMYLQNITPTINSPLIQAGYASLKAELDEHVTEVFAVEKALYSHHLELGMRCDSILRWDGIRTSFDAKTSGKQKKKEWIDSYFMQTCANAIAFEERTGLAVPQLAVVIACDDSPKAQVFIEKRDNWVKPLLETRAKYKEMYGR